MLLTARHLVPYCAATVVLTTCGDSGLTTVHGEGATIPLRIVAELVLPDPTTPALIEAASISGDTLRIHVSYAGGCRQHEFGLAAQRPVLESAPAEVIMALRHEGHGDPCRAGLALDVSADLRPLQALLAGGGTIRIGLYAPQADAPVDAQLEYTF